MGKGAYHLVIGNKTAAQEDYERIQAAVAENERNFGKIIGDTASATILPVSLDVGAPKTTSVLSTPARGGA
jgi:hypothetical protein